MTKSISLLFFVVIIGMAFIYFHKESGHKQRLKELQDKIDAIQRKYDSAGKVASEAHQRAKEYLIEATEARREALQSKERLIYANEQVRILQSRKPKRYTNTQLDSLLRARGYFETK